MPYTIYAECPCCGEKAHSKQEIEDRFGWRNVGIRKTIPQSYCRACRNAKCEAGKPCKRKDR